MAVVSEAKRDRPMTERAQKTKRAVIKLLALVLAVAVGLGFAFDRGEESKK